MQKILDFLRTKIGIAIIVALAIVLLAAGFKWSENKQTEAKGAATLVVEQIIRESIKNINEIENNPDYFASSTSDDTAAATDSPEPIYTATDRFSQEIFKEYIAAKQNGQEVSMDVSSRIAERVLAQDYSDKTTLYSVLNIQINPDSTSTSLKSYGNALGSILSTPPAARENELQIFQKLVTEPLDGYVTELNALKKRYVSMRTKLLNLAVPKNLASAHVAIVNGISLFIDAIDGALAIDIDPIGTLGKIAKHDDGVTLVQNALSSIKNTLSSSKVTFTSRESGFILTE